jgi:hypothetical protein
MVNLIKRGSLSAVTLFLQAEIYVSATLVSASNTTGIYYLRVENT